MLARSAQGLYWMGRYLERAEHLCRLLGLQAEALVDRPIREIYFGWRRLYDSMNRQPPFGKIELDSENYALADSYTLAGDLTFERSNPIPYGVASPSAARTARQMRHCISAEMWVRLNLTYLRVQKLDIETIWKTSPESFYAETAAEIDTFAGVAEATMYHDDGWSFMQFGRFVERAERAAAFFLFQLTATRGPNGTSDADWTTLLHAYHAFEAYSGRFSGEVQPDQVLDLLVTDPLLPGSLCRSLDLAAATLDAIGPGSDARSSAGARRLAGRLVAMVHYDWPDSQDRGKFLNQVGKYCRELHHVLSSAYFDYPIEDAPAR